MTASACPRCRGTISNIQCAKFLERTFCAKCHFRFCYRKDAPQQCLDLHVCDVGVGSPHGRTTVEAILAAAEKDRHRNTQRELRRRQRRQQSVMSLGGDVDAVSQLMAGPSGSFHLLTPRTYGDQPSASNSSLGGAPTTDPSPSAMMPTSLERDAQATLASLAMQITTLKQGRMANAAAEAQLVAVDAEQARQQLQGETDPLVLQQRVAGLTAERAMLLRHVDDCHRRETRLLKALSDCLGELQKQHRKRVQDFAQSLSATAVVHASVNGGISLHAELGAMPVPLVSEPTHPALEVPVMASSMGHAADPGEHHELVAHHAGDHAAQLEEHVEHAHVPVAPVEDTEPHHIKRARLDDEFLAD